MSAAAVDLVFDNVHYNTGNYNPLNGVYTVPYSGYYLITEQVCYTYTLISVTGSGHVKYMASPFFDFYMTTCLVL